MFSEGNPPRGQVAQDIVQMRIVEAVLGSRQSQAGDGAQGVDAVGGSLRARRWPCSASPSSPNNR